MSQIFNVRVISPRATITALVLAASATAGWGMSDARAAAIGVGSWRATGSLLVVRGDERVVTLANGRVLVVRAEDEGVTPTHPTFTEALATEFYEPLSATWGSGPSPSGENGSTIVSLVDGGALLLGEAPCDRAVVRCLATSATYRLNSTDSAWTHSAPMHEARVRPTVVRLADGRVLVAGGFGDDCAPRIALGYSCAPLASVEIFDPRTGVWSSAAPMPEQRGGAAATLLSDGSVLLVGGSTTREDALRYYPASRHWQTLGPTPALTGAKLLALAGDRAIAIGDDPDADFYGSLGGAGARAIFICRSIAAELYTAAQDTWTAAPPLPSGPVGCSTGAVALTTGQILYVAGGTRYVLDKRQQCWTPTGPSVTNHDGYLVALHDGRALDLGGSDSKGTPSTSVEIYTPGSQTCTVAQQLQTRIFRQLAPHGRALRVATVFKTGYTLSLDSPLRGRLRIDWYFQRETSEGQPGAVFVAAGKAVTRRGGHIKLTVKVLPAQRELLERPLEFQMTAKAVFHARGGQTVRTTSPLTLSGK